MAVPWFWYLGWRRWFLTCCQVTELDRPSLGVGGPRGGRDLLPIPPTPTFEGGKHRAVLSCSISSVCACTPKKTRAAQRLSRAVSLCLANLSPPTPKRRRDQVVHLSLLKQKPRQHRPPYLSTNATSSPRHPSSPHDDFACPPPYVRGRSNLPPCNDRPTFEMKESHRTRQAFESLDDGSLFRNRVLRITRVREPRRVGSLSTVQSCDPMGLNAMGDVAKNPGDEICFRQRQVPSLRHPRRFSDWTIRRHAEHAVHRLPCVRPCFTAVAVLSVH